MARQAVERAATVDEPTRLHALHDLGCLLAETGRNDEARAAFRQAIEEARTAGLAFVETFSILNTAKSDLVEREYESARTACASVLDDFRKVDDYTVRTCGWWGLGISLLELGRRRSAREAFAAMFDLYLAT